MSRIDKVRIGFVGVGPMGQCAHLKNYAVMPECEVVAIAELREGLGRKVASHYGVPNVYKNHEEMLNAEKLDGIVAVLHFRQHGVIVPELLKAGVPVFIEKPIAVSTDVGQKIVRAVKESGTWLMVGYQKRSDPATIRAKEEIERLKASGELGELRYVRITAPMGNWVAGGFDDLITSEEPLPELEQDPHPPGMDEETYGEYAGIVNVYVHQINLMRHLLGEPYEVTYAEPSRVLLVARSRSGVPGVIEISPYRTTVDWQESALAAFRHGYVKLDLPAPLAFNRAGRVEILRDPSKDAVPETVRPHLPWVHAMRRQAENFVAAIRGEAHPLCEAAEALEDLKVARQYIRLCFGN